MNKKTLKELNEELLSKISSGSLGQYRMNILDLMVPYYRSCYPELVWMILLTTFSENPIQNIIWKHQAKKILLR